MKAGIFVAPPDSEAKVGQCRAACAERAWAIAEDRVAVLDPEHPNQGLPVVLFSAVRESIDVLVVPGWADLVEGVLGSVYEQKPDVSGLNSRLMGKGLLSAQRFFSALLAADVKLLVVEEDRLIEPQEMVAYIRTAYAPLMDSAAAWDEEHSKAIREGQDRAWAEGRRVGRPPRRDSSTPP